MTPLQLDLNSKHTVIIGLIHAFDFAFVVPRTRFPAGAAQRRADVRPAALRFAHCRAIASRGPDTVVDFHGKALTYPDREPGVWRQALKRRTSEQNIRSAGKPIFALAGHDGKLFALVRGRVISDAALLGDIG